MEILEESMQTIEPIMETGNSEAVIVESTTELGQEQMAEPLTELEQEQAQGLTELHDQANKLERELVAGQEKERDIEAFPSPYESEAESLAEHQSNWSEVVEGSELDQSCRLELDFNLSNLFFDVEHLETAEKLKAVVAYVKAHGGESGIIYCATRTIAENVYTALGDTGIRSVCCHGGLSEGFRKNCLGRFLNGETKVLVTTNIFEEKFDKKDIRYVLHFNLPCTLGEYYQEVTQAGQDGNPAECILFWNDSDLSICRTIIEQEASAQSANDEEMLAAIFKKNQLLANMFGYCCTTECLSSYLVSTLLKEEDPSLDISIEGNDCGNCAHCTGDMLKVEVTDTARAIMRCVSDLNGEISKYHVVDILRGYVCRDIVLKEYNCLSSFGALDNSQTRIKAIIEYLVAHDYLQAGEGQNPMIGLGPRAQEVTNLDFRLEMKRQKGSKYNRNSLGFSNYDNEKIIYSSELFKALQALRREIAGEEKVAAYIVFTDVSLRDMCLKLPTTREEFLQVQGVGPLRLEKYGQRFLNEINGYLEQEKLAVS